jgi:pyridoxine 4-dehydrogenase
MTSIGASTSGQFRIGNITINRLGYGAMRGLLIATKAGLTRPGPGEWHPNGHPAHLIAQAKGSLRKLGVEQIDLWQLHRIDPRVPRDEQFGAVRRLLDDGIIRHAGLSEVSVADVEAARRVFPVATVQSRYNLVDRSSEDVLAYCAVNNMGFIRWFPLAAGQLTRPGGVVARVAEAHGATAGQVALAWLLQRRPVILPIPGTLRVAHLEENVAAAGLALTPMEIAELDAAA